MRTLSWKRPIRSKEKYNTGARASFCVSLTWLFEGNLYTSLGYIEFFVWSSNTVNSSSSKMYTNVSERNLQDIKELSPLNWILVKELAGEIPSTSEPYKSLVDEPASPDSTFKWIVPEAKLKVKFAKFSSRVRNVSLVTLKSGRNFWFVAEVFSAKLAAGEDGSGEDGTELAWEILFGDCSVVL